MNEVDPIYIELASRIRCEKSAHITKILAKMATREQAKILLEMPVRNSDEIADKLGMDKETVDAHIRELYEKGLVFKRLKGGLRAFYSATELKDATPTNPKFDEEFGEEFFDLWMTGSTVMKRQTGGFPCLRLPVRPNRL